MEQVVEMLHGMGDLSRNVDRLIGGHVEPVVEGWGKKKEDAQIEEIEKFHL